MGTSFTSKRLLIMGIDVSFMLHQELCKDSIRVKGRVEEGPFGITILFIESRVFPFSGLFVCSIGRRKNAWRRLLFTRGQE